jgi:hypothetical protein
VGNIKLVWWNFGFIAPNIQLVTKIGDGNHLLYSFSPESFKDEFKYESVLSWLIYLLVRVWEVFVLLLLVVVVVVVVVFSFSYFVVFSSDSQGSVLHWRRSVAD